MPAAAHHRSPWVVLIGFWVAVLLTLTACQLPQWRVFQKSVDAKMAEKPAEQTEAERRGAKFIKRLTITL